MNERTFMQLRTSQLRTDGGTQPRECTDQEVVEDYAEALKAGADFPPVVAFWDGHHYWLADGFHRLAAHILARSKTILVDRRLGTLRDAVLFAVGANVTHGMRRSNDDKHRAVLILLRDPEWGKWPGREIARRCGVSEYLVRVVKWEESAPGGGAIKTQFPPDGEEEDLVAVEAQALSERQQQVRAQLVALIARKVLALRGLTRKLKGDAAGPLALLEKFSAAIQLLA